MGDARHNRGQHPAEEYMHITLDVPESVVRQAYAESPYLKSSGEVSKPHTEGAQSDKTMETDSEDGKSMFKSSAHALRRFLLNEWPTIVALILPLLITGIAEDALVDKRIWTKYTSKANPFCEKVNKHGLLRQPRASWSSFAYWFVAVFILRRHKRTSSGRRLSAGDRQLSNASDDVIKYLTVSSPLSTSTNMRYSSDDLEAGHTGEGARTSQGWAFDDALDSEMASSMHWMERQPPSYLRLMNTMWFAVGLAMALLAVGSTLNHGCVCLVGGVLDWSGMLAALITVTATNVTALLARQATEKDELIIAVTVICLTTSLLSVRYGVSVTTQHWSDLLLGTVALGAVVTSIPLMIFGRCINMTTMDYSRPGRRNPLWDIAALAFAIGAFTIWVYDQRSEVCKETKGWLHALWHVMTAMCAVFHELFHTHLLTLRKWPSKGAPPSLASTNRVSQTPNETQTPRESRGEWQAAQQEQDGSQEARSSGGPASMTEAPLHHAVWHSRHRSAIGDFELHSTRGGRDSVNEIH